MMSFQKNLRENSHLKSFWENNIWGMTMEITSDFILNSMLVLVFIGMLILAGVVFINHYNDLIIYIGGFL